MGSEVCFHDVGLVAAPGVGFFGDGFDVAGVGDDEVAEGVDGVFPSGVGGGVAGEIEDGVDEVFAVFGDAEAGASAVLGVDF